MNIPSYRIVYSEIKKRLKDGTYQPHMLLPNEAELEKQFSVSRTTIRKAISLLVSEGFLRVKQGRGTEVLDISTTQKLNHITSITETLEKKGFKVTTQGMCIEHVLASEKVAQALDLSVGDSVYKLQRVQCTDGLPIAIMVNYLRENAVPDFEKSVNTFSGLYEFLEKKYHIVFKDAVERLSATSADFTESQILRVPFGSPLLCSKRISSNEQGPFEYSVIKLVADKYEYCVYLHGRA
jgi:GntR family transcriptional regulator